MVAFNPTSTNMEQPTRRFAMSGSVIVGGARTPIGKLSGALVLHLALELKRRGGGLGAAALCGGGGQGDALSVRVPA